MVLEIVFCNISEQTRDAGYWRVMFVLVEKISLIIVVLATTYSGMANAAFFIKIGEHIDVYLKQILIQMNIIWYNWVRKGVEIVAINISFV